MAPGTGLDRFQKEFPERFYDVGIAEQHAVTFAAGLATEGMKPVAAIYSTFLQRAYDQVVHDVCLQNLDVTFALDRAGWWAPTAPPTRALRLRLPAHAAQHRGDGAEGRERAPAHAASRPSSIPGPARRPLPARRRLRRTDGSRDQGASGGRGRAAARRRRPLDRGDRRTMVHPALEAAEQLAAEGISAAVLNARFVKPLDTERRILGWRALRRRRHRRGAQRSTGASAAPSSRRSPTAGNRSPGRAAWRFPTQLIEHGDRDAERRLGLDADGIAERRHATCSPEGTLGLSAARCRRLDERVGRRGTRRDPPRAQALILAGQVLVDDVPIDKAGTRVVRDDARRCALQGGLRASCRAVARSSPGPGGSGVLDVDRPRVPRRRRLDRVASPTACCRRGAVSVVAVDVGYGQLHEKLREDPRVTFARAHQRARTSPEHGCPTRSISSWWTSRSSRCACCCRRSERVALRGGELLVHGQAAVRGGSRAGGEGRRRARRRAARGGGRRHRQLREQVSATASGRCGRAGSRAPRGTGRSSLWLQRETD